MSLEDFQLIDNEILHFSFFKRDFIKKRHHRGAQLNHLDHNKEYIFGYNINYHQIGNSYSQNDIASKVALPVAQGQPPFNRTPIF